MQPWLGFKEVANCMSNPAWFVCNRRPYPRLVLSQYCLTPRFTAHHVVTLSWLRDRRRSGSDILDAASYRRIDRADPPRQQRLPAACGSLETTGRRSDTTDQTSTAIATTILIARLTACTADNCPSDCLSVCLLSSQTASKQLNGSDHYSSGKETKLEQCRMIFYIQLYSPNKW